MRIVGPEQGAVHTDLAVAVIQPGGWLAPHVHSFEESLYILEGELLLELAGTVHRLAAGDYSLMPTGYRHALGNSSAAPIRMLSLSSPQRLGPDAGRKDTFFEPAQDLAAMDAAAIRPPFGDPTLRLVGPLRRHRAAAGDAAHQGRGARPRLGRLATPRWSSTAASP